MRHISASGLHPLTIETGRIRGLLAKAAIAELHKALQSDGAPENGPDPRAEVVALLLAEQKRRLEDLSSQAEVRKLALSRDRLEAAARLRVIRTQRDELRRLGGTGEVPDDVEAVLTESLDREEAAITGFADALPRYLPST